METIIATIAIVLIVGGALAYIIRAKRRGQKCVGCPHSKTCGSQQCTCGQEKQTNHRDEF